MKNNLIINKGTLDDIEIPDIVYKYRDWEYKHHDRFIKNREIFLASPNSFEDEKDCKIPIRYDLLDKKQSLEFAIHLSKIAKPQFTRQQHREDCRKWVKKGLLKNKQFYENFLKKYFEQNNLRRGVLSLTAEPCLEEMWKKYANNSQGFCIGYNSKIMFESLGGGGKVEYYDELPLIFPEPIMNHFEKTSLLIFSKERKWEFEKEYRTHKFWENPASIKDRQIQLPKEVFNSIILGRNITDKVKNEIIYYVKEKIGDIPILEQTNFCS